MNCKRFYCLLVMLLLCLYGFSQAASTPNVQDVTKLSLVAPAISYEKKIGRLQTLQAQVFLNISFGIGYSSSLGYTSFLYASPAAGVQYRYYYNGARRAARGKRTDMNSMNYLAPVYTLAYSSWSVSEDHYGEDKRRAFHTAGVVWGFQRNFTKGFSLDINVGPGIAFANTTFYNENYEPTRQKMTSAFQLMGQVRLGFWL